MNCPKCKSPLQVDSAECEWCGNKIISDFQTVNPVFRNNNRFNNRFLKYILYLILLVLSIILTMNNEDIPFHFIVFGGIVFFEIFNYFKKIN